MDKNLYSSINFIDKMITPDLKLLEETKEYKMLNANADQYLTIERMLKGKEVSVIGDVRKIEIKGKNRVYLHITYSLSSNALYKERTKIFEILDEKQKEYAKCHILPTTGIEIIAKYTGCSNFDNVATFEVVKINKINQKLNFGYYFCAGDNPDLKRGSDMCHHNFGYNTNDIERNYCVFCGSSLKCVNDIYEENI